MAAGFVAAGAEVVPFRWDQVLKTVSALTGVTLATGAIAEDHARSLRSFLGWLAAADVVTAALEHDVDAVFVVNGLLFPPQRAAVLRKLGIPVACYGTEAPYFHEHERAICGAYSHWFTQERRSVDFFRPHVPHAHYLPMAYNPAQHAPDAPDPGKAADVVFVGGGYKERRRLLDGVDWTGITHQRIGTLWDMDWDHPPADDDGAAYSAGAVPNTETTAWHRSAAIALNLHRRMTTVASQVTIPDGVAESLGPRAYEIPASGGFMLCDDERPELFDVYGDAAASFRAWDAADLERQIRSWLARPDARERQRQAQRQAVAPHTWAARAASVLTILGG